VQSTKVPFFKIVSSTTVQRSTNMQQLPITRLKKKLDELFRGVRMIRAQSQLARENGPGAPQQEHKFNTKTTTNTTDLGL
jgi:hypothetical protein